jgi:3-hydroxyacyl-CoA dehydrogenase/3a,7a,12a-trihydroxy-5b-cholest-24-enoyl-CoA hydratase
MREAVELDESLKDRFNALVQFIVDGETMTLDARRSNGKNEGGDKPDLVVKTSVQVLLDLLEKKIKPQQAFMKGKLRIKGKMSLAMKLSMVLDATRKQLALNHSRL